MKVKNGFGSLLLFIVVGFFCACQDKPATDWNVNSNWYATVDSVDSNFVDVFYVASTNVVASYDDDSTECFLAKMDSAERSWMAIEMDFVRKQLFYDSLNFFSPYYYQFTLNAVKLPEKQYLTYRKQASKEVCKAFDQYIKERNNGRLFVLAGFSQGAMIVKEILRHMDGKTYQRMVAAYMIGDGLNAKDLECKHIKPVQSVLDLGVTISYNSVADTAAVWDVVQEESEVCVNPVNWCNDSSEATFIYNGKILTVKKNIEKQVLVVSGFEPEHLDYECVWPEGNLHHYDVMLYNAYMANNLKMRIATARSQMP